MEESMQTNQSKSNYVLPVVGVLAVAVFGGMLWKNQMATSNNQNVAEVTQEITAVDTYKDGEYMATGNYISPAGPEEIEVKLTIKDGKIATAQAVSKATNEKSMFMQKMFVDNFQPMVVGKNLNEVKLDKVAGSSLTPKGFNEAVDEIKAQAKV